ncbi:MAG TPA: Rpn family recombination-promoting nuclease/putative transposase [Allocoleopsis sp.]
MKTDTIFYRLFQSFPSIFFELIDQPPEEASAYQFSSVEVKQLSFRIDGVFLPTSNTPSLPIYFVEVQFQQDSNFYSRLFAEIFLYLRQNKQANDWRAVVIYPTQNVDTGNILHYREFFASQRVRRVYLDELGSTPGQSIGIEILKLVIEPEETAGIKARELIAQTRRETADEATQQEFIQLIETIIVYKFTQKSREEIAEMLGLSDLKQTRVYQEALEEGKLETVPFMLTLGLSLQQIAEGIGLDVEQVRQKAISHLLATGMSVEQVAETLNLEIEAVRQIEASIAQDNESSEEE